VKPDKGFPPENPLNCFQRTYETPATHGRIGPFRCAFAAARGDSEGAEAGADRPIRAGHGARGLAKFKQTGKKGGSKTKVIIIGFPNIRAR
jgi:hypothetical protein